MSSGIVFSLKDGKYRPITIGPINPRLCWDLEFQNALREIAGDTYPEALYDLSGDRPHVVYTKINSLGVDELRNSPTILQRRPPEAEVSRIQNELEIMHAMVYDPHVPADIREFFQKFKLPDPRFMPECWRVTGWFFSRRLHVLWGLDSVEKYSTLLPMTTKSAEWNDAAQRTYIGDALGVTPYSFGNSPHSWEQNGHGWLRRIVKWLLWLALAVLLAFLLRSCMSDYRCNDTPVSVVSTPSTPSSEGDSGAGAGGCSSGGASKVGGSPCGGPSCAPDIPPTSVGGGAGGCSSGGVPKVGGSPCGGPSCAPDIPSGSCGGCTPDKPNAPSSSSKPPSNDDPDRGKTIVMTPKKDNPMVESVKALSCSFKVDSPKVLPGSDSEVAKVEFSVSPIQDGSINGKAYKVFDWRIDDDVKQPGEGNSFRPEGGLRYDRSYTIKASVTVDGEQCRVEPYQWNLIDRPTWQVLEIGRNDKSEMRRYRLVCCNSSSIKPKAKDWQVKFRTTSGGSVTNLDFEVVSNCVGDDIFEMKKNIRFFEGAYFMEIKVGIQYILNGRTNDAVHVETFPFTHDSTAESLTKAKYEVVIPNIYFCLAKIQRGSVIVAGGASSDASLSRFQSGTLINGTAFAISDKKLISNFHVAVGGIPECYANSGSYKVVGPVTLTNIKGKTYYARVEHADRGRDLALLVLCDKYGKDVDTKLPGYLHLSDDDIVDKIKRGESRHVFAIGYPKGTVCMGPPAFTDGKAEEVKKRLYRRNGKTEAYDTIYNFTNTECGYSGGPLIDYETDSVLGVNFGGLVERLENHKPAALATSISEVRIGLPSLMGR